jgi:hypothetical protein
VKQTAAVNSDILIKYTIEPRGHQRAPSLHHLLAETPATCGAGVFLFEVYDEHARSTMSFHF